MAAPTSVNDQITDAVTDTAGSASCGGSRQPSATTDCQEFAQGFLEAVQRGATQLQDLFLLNAAATGTVLASLLQDRDRGSDLEELLEASQGAVEEGIANLIKLAGEAGTVLRTVPEAVLAAAAASRPRSEAEEAASAQA